MEKKQPARIWRWMALVSVFLNIALNYWTNINPINGQRIGEVSDQYPTLFTPAGYAFSIWGLIYLAFIIYVIYQLLPAQRKDVLFDRLAGPLIATSLLSIIWLISFSHEMILVSVLILIAMLLNGIVLLVRTRRWIAQYKRHQWVSIPFGLYAGWLSVATIANVAIGLSSLGWQGGAWGEAPWAIIMIIVAFVIGMLISWHLRDVVYPLVIVWASVAIWFARKDEQRLVASMALACAVVLFIWVIGYGIWLFRHSLRRIPTA